MVSTISCYPIQVEIIYPFDWLIGMDIWAQLGKGICGYPLRLCKYRWELVLCRVSLPMLIAVLEAK